MGKEWRRLGNVPTRTTPAPRSASSSCSEHVCE
jgi:hypothetical protein